MIKKIINLNGFCNNDYCVKTVKGDYIYCYDCYLDNDKLLKIICNDCNKMVKLGFKRCYECNIKKKRN